jgi:hypothetical protein
MWRRHHPNIEKVRLHGIGWQGPFRQYGYACAQSHHVVGACEGKICDEGAEGLQ